MYDQGDIVILPFPYSDLTGAKQRPALIISNEKLNKTDDRICCLITSKKSKGIMLKSNLLSIKLPFQSWVKPQRIFTIHKEIIRKRISKVNKELYEDIYGDIQSYLTIR